MGREYMKRYLVAVVGLALAITPGFAQSKSFQLGSWIEIQNAILKELDRSYVDTLPLKKMQRAAIDAMLAELDPYTVYVPAEEVEDFSNQLGKSYGGIGAIITKEEGKNVILNEPYANSPCVLAGLESGDEILTIDGQDVKPWATKECSDRMKGQPGSSVEFLVKKVHSGDTLKVKVRRERIHIPDVTYAGMIEPKTGYIQVTGFTEGVGEIIRGKVKELKSQGMEKLFLDLRGNGGGLLSEAVEIVSIFLPKGSLVVTAKGRDEQNVQTYLSSKEPLDVNLKLAVLVDGGSASSSEIVSGALQDMDRATIIGTRTFGKGLVQNIRPLPYGGQLKITVSKYYTPSGRCVQAIDYSKRNADGSVGHIPDSLTHEFKTAGGRTVRDGGGITPDIVIPAREYDEMLYYLILGGSVDAYALHYKQTHPQIGPAEDFVFDEMEDFKSFVLGLLKEESKAEFEAMDLEQFRPFIEEEIITRYYFQEEGVRRRLRYDEQLKAALKSNLVL